MNGHKKGKLTSALYGMRTLGAYLHRPQFELYDVINDPDEIHNLAYDDKYNLTVSGFVEKMKAFQKRTDDPWILK